MPPLNPAPDQNADVLASAVSNASLLEEELRSSFIQMVNQALGGERTSSFSENDGPSDFALEKPLDQRAAIATPPSQIASRFTIERAIGSGGFGTVYLAHDEALDRDVAIKVPHEKLLEDPQFHSQCLKEARLAAKLRHPSIVTIFDIHEQDGRITHIVQEYVKGATLYDLLSQQRFSVKQTILLVIKVAEAIAFAHAHGVYHRDLKPANLIIEKNAGIRVLDFGLAVDEEMQRGARGQVAGTIAYMSPEQIEGRTHHLDGRTDIWSLGVIFYELLTGRRPFRGSTNEISDQVIHREAAPPRQFIPEIPKKVEACCLKCLSKSVSGRYATAIDLLEDLNEIIKTGDLPEEIPGEPTPVMPQHDTKRLGKDTTKQLHRKRVIGLQVSWWLGCMGAIAIGVCSLSIWGILTNYQQTSGTGESDERSDVNLLDVAPERWVEDPDRSNITYFGGELSVISAPNCAIAFKPEITGTNYDIHLDVRKANWAGDTSVLFGARPSGLNPDLMVAHRILIFPDPESSEKWLLQYGVVTINVASKQIGPTDWVKYRIDVKTTLEPKESIRIEIRNGSFKSVRIGGVGHQDIAILSSTQSRRVREVMERHGIPTESITGKAGIIIGNTDMAVLGATAIRK